VIGAFSLVAACGQGGNDTGGDPTGSGSSGSGVGSGSSGSSGSASSGGPSGSSSSSSSGSSSSSSSGSSSSSRSSGTGSSGGGSSSSSGSSSSGSSGSSSGSSSGGGAHASVRVEASGTYSVTFTAPAWTFSGSLGAPASAISTQMGSDRLGSYSETVFTYAASGARKGRIRAYDHTPVVVFGESSVEAVANTRNFPKLTSVPSVPYHITYGGVFIDYSMKDLANNGDSPWVFFDGSASTFIVSGASHFMNTSTTQLSGGGIASGIQANIKTLPAGFETTTVLVADTGINRAYDTWGKALLAFTGKKPVPSDATPVLARFGIWNDNGAYYFYRTESGKNYETTLKDEKAYYEQGGIPVAYIQLDSWWYLKGPAQVWNDSGVGIYEYKAHPTNFPSGLAAFQQATQVALITHARWIVPSSPYRSRYRFSRDVIIDPEYWKSIASYLKSSGVTTYEQDWLSYRGSPDDTNLTDQDAYLDNMASAMADVGIDMQYCMIRGRQVLQSTKYANLTNGRVSDDRFDRRWWRTFFYGSRLAWSVGIWPWTDNFRSPEHDNLLISNLSAGIFGASDQIGQADLPALKRALRADGTIIKPDVPILLMDRSIVDEAKGGGGATLATTYTQHEGGRFTYVFVFSDKAGVTATFTPAELGYTGDVFVHDVNAGSGKVLGPTQASSTTLAATTSTAYYVVAPVGASKIAFLGEKGKIAALGRKRISSYTDDGTVTVGVAYGEGEETVTLQGYAPAAPTVTALTGQAGTVAYDATTKLFSVPVKAAGAAAIVQIKP
jgi:hypothetical protein